MVQLAPYSFCLACSAPDRHACCARAVAETWDDGHGPADLPQTHAPDAACPARCCDVRTYLARLEVPENFTNHSECKKEITRCAFHHEFHIEYPVDRFAKATHDGKQLLSNQDVAKLSVRGQRTIKASMRVM
eukprot:6194439-Pleurochrysis_carterae.AAC.2